MGKRILVLGVGAQGTTVAQRMDSEAAVEEIICADRDRRAVVEAITTLTKGTAAQVDATDPGDVARLAQGVDLIVNALPLEFGRVVLEAALTARAHYQDFAAPLGIVDEDELVPGIDPWLAGIEALFRDYGPRFAAIGRLAVVGTGAAPGLICVATRLAVRELDRCDTILNLVYEGVEARRFQPFWWSPVTALSDMSEDAYALIDGRVVRTPAFGLPVTRRYDYLEKTVRLVEHAHDEPVYYGLHAGSHLKGVREAYFKYGGVGIEFAEPLHRAGLLSHDSEPGTDGTVIPFDLILHHLPPAPKYYEEIQSIIDEGLVRDEGFMVAEALGLRHGVPTRVETHVFAPGLVESFARSGLTAEMYVTGQGGALFTKLFANDVYQQTGLITSDMLTEPEIDYYVAAAADLGITFQTRVVAR